MLIDLTWRVDFELIHLIIDQILYLPFNTKQFSVELICWWYALYIGSSVLPTSSRHLSFGKAKRLVSTSSWNNSWTASLIRTTHAFPASAVMHAYLLALVLAQLGTRLRKLQEQRFLMFVTSMKIPSWMRKTRGDKWLLLWVPQSMWSGAQSYHSP